MTLQLDIFEHSRDVTLNNTVIAAFACHDLNAAEIAVTSLRSEFPLHPNLSAHDELIQQLRLFAARVNDKDLAECRRQLLDQIQPISITFFGAAHQQRWARPLWQQLADLASATPFVTERAELHTAALWLAAGEHQMAKKAVTTIPPWRKIPAPLAWMTEIELRTGHPETYWPLLAELAWLAPKRLDKLHGQAPAKVCSLLHRFSADFENNSEEDDLAWFPAWLLISAPEMREFLRPAQAENNTAAQAFSRLLDLLHREKTGQQHDLIVERHKLRALAPDIFALYMRSR